MNGKSINIDFKKIDLFYDFIDKACMILYDELRIDYFEALIRVCNDITTTLDESKLTENAVKELQEIYNAIENENFYNEEIRMSLELLIIKAFKHINFSLDLMTPDTINYIISMIIKSKYGYSNKEIWVMDTCLGTGNLLNAISNNLDTEVNLTGIENNETLVKLAKASSDIQGNFINIFFQDALQNIESYNDVVVGDLASYDYTDSNDLELYKKGIKYFPYLVIEARLKNIIDNGYFIFVIDNDFFSKSGNNEFRNYLNGKATLVGLIVLPRSIVSENHVGKSILIGKKASLDNFNMNILNVKDFSLEESKKLFEKIDNMMKQI